ncbi:hypothetical protein F5Y07DRAFT_370455 [Xylaria sp. FL0933]|nr:hypothetical protein F5Y07DRAFT_370455 [Xylaria sp. FL0933]
MIQLPSQAVVPIVQLVVTTLQLLLMLFTWLNPRGTRPFIGQYRAEATMASQHTFEMSSVNVPGLAGQLTPSMQQPGISHPHSVLSSSTSGVRDSQAQQRILSPDDSQQVEHHAANHEAPVPV